MGYIQFDDIHKSFGNNEVLKGITMGIEKGHMATLLGPSGCGKSTLLRCLAGLEEVTSGRVYLDGKDITEVTPRNRNIGMVFQQYSLFPNMNVYPVSYTHLDVYKRQGTVITPSAKDVFLHADRELVFL